MTLDEKLSQGAVLVTDAWESLADTWVQAVQELLHSLTADPFGLFHPAFVADQVFDLAGRSFEISLNLISDLTGASTGEPAVEHATEAGIAPIALAPPLEAIQPEVIDPPHTRSRDRPTGRDRPAGRDRRRPTGRDPHPCRRQSRHGRSPPTVTAG